MEVLKDYPEEYAKTFQESFSCLFKINVKFWFHGEGFVTRYWRFLYIVPIFVIFSITMTKGMCKGMVEGDIYEITFLLPPYLIFLQGVSKILVVFLKSNQITNIIKELGAIWRTKELNDKQNEERKQLLKWLNLYGKGNYWYTVIGAFLSEVSPLLEALFCKFILQKESVLRLPLAYSYPFDPTGNWVVYIATYAFQMFSMYPCVLAFAGTQILLITLCALLAIEFTLLCEDLLHVKPVSKRNKNSSNDTNEETLTIENIVKKHQTLISLSTQMDDVFNILIFIDLMFVGVSTCFFGYACQFTRGPLDNMTNYTGVVYLLLNALFMCYYGEKLTGSSLRIGEVAYENHWYKGDKHYQKIILMIIKRSQKACCLTSMKYAPITLNMFTKVISTTWSYFSVMNNIYGKE